MEGRGEEKILERSKASITIEEIVKWGEAGEETSRLKDAGTYPLRIGGEGRTAEGFTLKEPKMRRE